MTNIFLFLLGSGILDHPALAEIIGMVISGIALLAVVCWTFWLDLCTSAKHVENRNLKSVLGVIFIILLYFVFSFFNSAYEQKMRQEHPRQQSGSKTVCWKVVKGVDGNTYIYEINI